MSNIAVAQGAKVSIFCEMRAGEGGEKGSKFGGAMGTKYGLRKESHLSNVEILASGCRYITRNVRVSAEI